MIKPNAHQQVVDLIEQLKIAALTRPLSRRFDELSDEIVTLTSAYMLPSVPVDWIDLGLTAQEQRVMHALETRKGRCLNNEMLMNAMFFDRPDCDWPEAKIVDVLVCKIRAKLRKHRDDYPAVEIETVWGLGYRYKELDHA